MTEREKEKFFTIFKNTCNLYEQRKLSKDVFHEKILKLNHYYFDHEDEDNDESSFIYNYLLNGKPTATFKQLLNEIDDNAINFAKNMDYKDFLNSTYWKVLSYSVKKKRGDKCEKCGSKINLNVHHLTYRHRGNEINHLDDLVCLCSNCHAKIHHKKIA